MSFYTRSNIDDIEPFHVYYDISIVNNDTTGTKAPAPIIFNEIRTSPIIHNASEWFLSVIRFSIDTVSLPLFIPQVKLGQADYNRTIYTITLTYEYNGTVYEFQAPVMFVPQDLSVVHPNPPLVFQDVSNSYYFVYSYTHFVNMVNATFVTAFNGLKALVTAAGGVLPSENPPFMEFDPNSCVPILDCDILGYNASLASPIKIYFNAPMYTLFSSFQADYFGTNVTNGKNFQINVYSINNSNVLNLPTYNALQMYAEYAPTPIWNPVATLVFTTGLLPVSANLTSKPNVFNSEANLFSAGNNNNFSQVITDMMVNLTKGNETKPFISYVPQAEYRMIDLNGNASISSIEIRVWWKDKWGNLHPLELSSGCSASLKIMFRKKSYNSIK